MRAHPSAGAKRGRIIDGIPTAFRTTPSPANGFCLRCNIPLDIVRVVATPDIQGKL